MACSLRTSPCNHLLAGISVFFSPARSGRSSMYQLEETMDDSSLFMQWAVDTLQHEHPPVAAGYAAGDTFPSLQELRRSALQQGTAPAGQDVHCHLAADSWSSGDSAGGGHENTSAAVVENDVWSPSSAKCATTCSVGSSNYLPMSWNFTSALAQPSNEVAPSPATGLSGANDGPGVTVTEQAHVSPPSRRASAKSSARTGHAPYAQDHIMAERRRREKINRRFIELSTVIPGLKKMDKATILSDAVKYVKEQQEKLKALEDRNLRGVESVVLVKTKSRTAAVPEDDVGGCCQSPSAGAVAGSTTTTTTTGSALPEIEARISESNVMVRIHCEDAKGVLVRLLAEVEGLHLSITHLNAIPFPACTVIITVTAKVDEGFSVTAEDIVAKIEAALPAPTS